MHTWLFKYKESPSISSKPWAHERNTLKNTWQISLSFPLFSHIRYFFLFILTIFAVFSILYVQTCTINNLYLISIINFKLTIPSRPVTDQIWYIFSLYSRINRKQRNNAFWRGLKKDQSCPKYVWPVVLTIIDGDQGFESKTY